MKFKFAILAGFLALSLGANSLEIDKLRTELYSKSGVNVLKKIELSLEFDGLNKADKKKLTDGVLTVISGFFYEDIFTESGKNNFKRSLSKFMDKKYKIKFDEVYFLALSGVEKFDIEEFKRFLASTESVQDTDELKKALDEIKPVEVPKVQTPKIDENITNVEQISPVQTPVLTPLPQLFNDNENGQNTDDINADNLNLPKLSPELNEKIANEIMNNAKMMKAKQNTGENSNLQTLPSAESNQTPTSNTQESTLPELNVPLNSQELEAKFGNE